MPTGSSESKSSTREAAALLRERGLALCKPDPKEKRPTAKGWSVKSLEPDDFTEGDQIGILGGPLSHANVRGAALVIVDLDAREAVERADEFLPATAMVEGRPGKRKSHRYFLVPFDSTPDWARSHADQAAPAAERNYGHPGPFKKSFDHFETKSRVIDFIGTGGQAVCPPSVWTSADGTRTERREWEDGSPGEPATVPFLDLWTAVCELASACGAEIPDVAPRQHAERPAGKAAATVIDRAKKWLDKAGPSIAGQGGDKQLFTVARAIVWGFDIDPETALDLLDHWNARCVPPWGRRVLEHNVRNADRLQSREPRGYKRDKPRANADEPKVVWGASGDKPPGHSAYSAHSARGWAPPVPLNQLPDVPPFPVETLPTWLADLVRAQAVELQVPPDLPALLGLGVAAAGIARKVTVTPWEGWEREPTNLFAMPCLLPGERKSQTFTKMFAPVADLERELRQEAEPLVKEAESELRIATKKLEHLEGKIAKASGEERAQLAEELKEARQEVIEKQAALPVMPVLRVDDDTPESLALELVKQGGRLLAASPEARTIENITRYSDKPNADVFLKGHAGDDIRSGRVSRGRDEVERAALSCVFSPQPCVLEGLAETPELRGRGFLARWLYALPKSDVGYRQVDPPPPAVPKAVRDNYHALVTRLWRVTEKEEFGARKPHALHFTRDAAGALRVFLVWVEENLRPGTPLASLCGWGNKIGGLCVRLCGVFHAADGAPAGNEWLALPITAGVVDRAVRLCREYAVPHAIAAFDLMGANEVLISARAVLTWLKRRSEPASDFTKRDLFNACRATFKTVGELDPPLALLEQHSLIRPKECDGRPGPGRKPSPGYEVNPDAFRAAPHAHNTHNTQNSGRGAEATATHAERFGAETDAHNTHNTQNSEPEDSAKDERDTAHNTQNTHNGLRTDADLNSAYSAYSARGVPDPESPSAESAIPPDDLAPGTSDSTSTKRTFRNNDSEYRRAS